MNTSCTLRRWLGSGAFAFALLASASASADEDTGPRVGARLGYGMLMGSLEGGGSTVGDSLFGQIPIWLDAGYRIHPRLFLGAYFQYDFLVGRDPDHLCDGDASCSATDKRFGIELHDIIMKRVRSSLWIGAGTGYEKMDLKMVIAGEELSYTLLGYEYGNIQLGYDFETETSFSAGPFISFSMGKFHSSEKKAFHSTDAEPNTIESQAMHQWLVVGAYGSLDI